MKVTAIIPAKGTSQRIENKNLYKVNGKTLVEMACEKVLQCKSIDEVYIDTESEKVLLNVEHLFKEGLKLIKRPKELANNDIGANEMLVYGLHSASDCDLILQTFSTSPLITSKTIDQCVTKFLSRGNIHDSFFTVNKMQEYLWDLENGPINFDIGELPNSFELDPIYVETHGLYGIYTEKLLKLKTRVGENPMLIPISKIESFDIDDMEDLEIVETLIQSQIKK
jgi:CMP-N-acetylneuraminic acid synthetase